MIDTVASHIDRYKIDFSVAVLSIFCNFKVTLLFYKKSFYKIIICSLFNFLVWKQYAKVSKNISILFPKGGSNFLRFLFLNFPR